MGTVSVALATFNGARYIAKQLDSLAEQTLVPHELVIFDDGSDDDTASIVVAFSAKAPFPVHFQINAKRLGYADNFLAAAKACSGTYVAFCDQDDVWLPEKLERSVSRLEEENAVLCVHTATLIDEAGIPIGSLAQGITETQVSPARHLSPWDVFLGFTQVFDRRLLELVEPSRRGLDNHALGSMLAHDRWIFALATNLGRTVMLAEPLANYRQHGANLYGGKKKRLLVRLLGKFVGSAARLRAYAEIANRRASMFREIAESEAAEIFTSEARAADRRWSDIAEVYRRRAELYEEPALRRRVVQLAALSRQRTYQTPDRGGLGHTVFLKDFGLGVLGLNFDRLIDSRLTIS